MADAIHKNYVITPSVDGSGNLTIAIKTLAGADPSAGDPVLFKIGNSWRAVTAALSVTISAGANTFDAGSSEIATKAVGLFCYVGYNSTDGVTFGTARIPHALKYSTFSTTATDETYCAISDITSASANDVYTVVGYFEATLSAGAAYTWSSPTNVKNYPIYETNWLTWVPSFSASGSMTYTSTVVTDASYKVVGQDVHFTFYVGGTTGGSASTAIKVSHPFTATLNTNPFVATVTNGGVALVGRGRCNTSDLDVYLTDGSAWGLGTSRELLGDGRYRIS